MHRPYLVGAAAALFAVAAIAGTPAMATPCTNLQSLGPVSYTHLTLPTIYSV